MTGLASIPVSEVREGLLALERIIADARLAIDAKGKDVGADIQVAIDVADALSGLPIVGATASAAEKGLIVLKFVLQHGQPITDKAPNYNAPAGSDNVSTGG